MKPHQKILLSYLKENRLCYIDWLTSTGTIQTTQEYLESLNYKNVLIVTKKVNSIAKHFVNVKNDTINITYLPISILKLDTFKPIVKEYDVIILFNFIYELETVEIQDLRNLIGEMKSDSKFLMFAHDDKTIANEISKIGNFYISVVQTLEQLKELDKDYYRYKKINKLQKNEK